ncbi:hypothetical protein T484DRAFT_1789868 [Baffinella frigidus]|nr:hypothetical protein T484DRAFT_1789868 [Cryptophyta sp. CCMP2293]
MQVPKQFRMFRPVKESVIRTLAAAKKDSTQQYKGTAVQDPAGDVAAPHVLSLAMASLGEEMLKLGLFSSKDEIQTGLIPALALHLDMPAVGGCVEEVDTKVVVCRMLIKICDVRLGVRVPLLLAVFKTVTSEGKGSERSEIELRRMTEQLVSSANEDIHKLLSFLSLTLLKADGQAIARQLVKLIGVPREDLALLALQLLLRERSPKLELFRELSNTQREQSPKLELFRELSNTQILLEPATISAYRRCSSHMRNIRHVLPLLKSALAGDFEAVGTMSSSKRLSVLEALEDCGTMCKVAAGKDGGRVALVNTETVRRAGMQQLVIDIISSALVPYADPNGRFVLGDARGNNHESPKAGAGGSFQTGNSKKTSMEWLHGVLQLCFRFVEHTAHISEQTQMAFAPHVRLLLALAGEGCHAVSAVSAICHNNLKLCVSLDEALIERLAAVIAGSDGKPARRLPHYLRFLERLCVVQGTAVLQNQHYVLKQLCQKGPLKLSTTSLPPGASANHAASATAEIPEAALVLFRGVAGERMRHLLAEQGIRGVISEDL